MRGEGLSLIWPVNIRKEHNTFMCALCAAEFPFILFFNSSSLTCVVRVCLGCSRRGLFLLLLLNYLLWFVGGHGNLML